MVESGSSDRSFGVVFAVVFAAIGAWPLFESGAPRTWALIVSAAFLLFAVARPSTLAPLNRVWTKFGLLLSKFTNPIVLGLVYFLVLTPFAVAIRLFGRDALRLKADAAASTYWIERTPSGPTPQSIKNQF